MREPDLEAPYQAMCREAAKIEDIEDAVFDELVDEMGDNQRKCEQFLSDWSDDPHVDAARMMAEIAACWNTVPEVFTRRLKGQFRRIVADHVEREARIQIENAD